MDLMNGLQRVNLTAMRLATLIWLAGIACCVPGMAAEPQQKEQTAAEKADRPRQQEISFQSIAPVPGLPSDMVPPGKKISRVNLTHGFDAGGRNPAERA